MKVFDAIEAVEANKPRLVLVSAVDIRSTDIIPSHYVRETSSPRDSILTPND